MCNDALSIRFTPINSSIPVRDAGVSNGRPRTSIRALGCLRCVLASACVSSVKILRGHVPSVSAAFSVSLGWSDAADELTFDALHTLKCARRFRAFSRVPWDDRTRIIRGIIRPRTAIESRAQLKDTEVEAQMAQKNADLATRERDAHETDLEFILVPDYSVH